MAKCSQVVRPAVQEVVFLGQRPGPLCGPFDGGRLNFGYCMGSSARRDLNRLMLGDSGKQPANPDPEPDQVYTNADYYSMVVEQYAWLETDLAAVDRNPTACKLVPLIFCAEHYSFDDGGCTNHTYCGPCCRTALDVRARHDVCMRARTLYGICVQIYMAGRARDKLTLATGRNLAHAAQNQKQQQLEVVAVCQQYML